MRWFNTQPSQCILQLLFWGNYCLTVTTAANLNWYVLAQESPNQQEEEESLGHIQIKSGVESLRGYAAVCVGVWPRFLL